MKLSEIYNLFSFNQDVSKTDDIEIQWLLTDSRSLSFPDATLFFALQSERNDGHNYIAELYQHELRYFVVSKILPEWETMNDAVFILVEDTLQALQKLVGKHRSKFQIPVIGITGSNGKTVVKEWFYQLLHTDFHIIRSPKSYNSQIGVPLSVWKLNEETELGIFEAGISKMGEMEKLQPIISPTIGIFTNLGDAHQEGFSGLKQKAAEKMKLFKNAEVLIYNSDNKLLTIAAKQAQLKATHFTWGKNSDAALQIIEVIKNTFSKIRFQYKKAEFNVKLPFIDDASIENAIQCVCLLLHLNYSVEEISNRLEKLEPISMRLEVKEGTNGLIIINDTYNSDLNSLRIALDFQNQKATANPHPKTLILSDIFQSGFSSKELYNEIAALIHTSNIKKLIGVGKELVQWQKIFNVDEKYFFNSTNELLGSTLLKQLKNEIILLKGSRDFHFESILSRLELQVHETILDVSLNAFIHNFNYFRSHLKKETKTMCMVKAFGYGSGSIEIARTLQNNGCDYLAVAVADEGAELRNEGIRLPIVVMNPEKGAFDTIFQSRLEPEIYSFGLLNDFIKTVEKWGVTDYPIHIKIDSGMHRLGFNPNEMVQLIEILKGQNQVKIRSVFSHLVGSDNIEFDDFTHRQVETFVACADQISAHFSHPILRHILNSAGIERFPAYQFDMVRLGIGLFSISSIQGVHLEPVCTLSTVILQIRDVKANETVGYGRKGKLHRDSKIGVIPIGYADGFNRKLGNGNGEVWVNGAKVKIVGNICMDLSMIDLTDILATEGDKVEIFGKNILIEEQAEKLETIPYEILASVSKRVKRVYFVD